MESHNPWLSMNCWLVPDSFHPSLGRGKGTTSAALHITACGLLPLAWVRTEWNGRNSTVCNRTLLIHSEHQLMACCNMQTWSERAFQIFQVLRIHWYNCPGRKGQNYHREIMVRLRPPNELMARERWEETTLATSFFLLYFSSPLPFHYLRLEKSKKR